MRASRKALFSVVLVAAAAAGIEIGSALLLRWASPADPGKLLADAARSAEQRAQDPAPSPSATADREVVHPYLGYVIAPPEGSATGELTLETLGFENGGPFVGERRADTAVIGIFGGSVAHLFSVWQGTERVFDVLRALPEFQGKRLLAVNAAQDGYKQPQSLLALSYLLSLGAQFDVVILIDGFNEVALPPVNNASRGVFPFFPTNWWLRVARLEGAPRTRARIGEISYLGRLREEWAEWLRASPLRHSSTAFLAWVLWDRRLAARLSMARMELLIEASGDEFD